MRSIPGFLVRAIVVLSAVSVSSSFAVAQSWPDPNGGAGFFVSTVPGLVATTICVDEECTAANLNSGGHRFMPDGRESNFQTDVLGRVYRSGVEYTGEYCIIGAPQINGDVVDSL